STSPAIDSVSRSGELKNDETSYPTRAIVNIMIAFAASNIYKYTTFLRFDKAAMTLITDVGVKGSDSRTNRKTKPRRSMNDSIWPSLLCFLIYFCAGLLQKYRPGRAARELARTLPE